MRTWLIDALSFQDDRKEPDMVQRKLSFLVPLTFAVSLFAAACGPAANPAPSAPPAPTTAAAAPKPTTAPAAQATTAPAAAQPTTAAAAPKPTVAPAAAPTTAPAAQPAANPAGQPVKGGQLVVATSRDATTLDPTKSQEVYSNAIIGLVSDSLYKVDDKAQVVGPLVEKTDNPQPNVYLLTLRKGI